MSTKRHPQQIAAGAFAALPADIGEQFDTITLLRSLIQVSLNRSGADEGVLYLYDRDSRQLHRTGRICRDPRSADTDHDGERLDHLAWRSWRQRRPLTLSDVPAPNRQLVTVVLTPTDTHTHTRADTDSNANANTNTNTTPETDSDPDTNPDPGTDGAAPPFGVLMLSGPTPPDGEREDLTLLNAAGETGALIATLLAQNSACGARPPLHTHATQQTLLENSERRYRALFLQSEKQAKGLRLLDNLQNAIADKLELDQLYRALVDTISDIFHYDLVLITLLRENRLWTGPYRGYVPDDMPTSIDARFGLVGKAAVSGEPVLAKNVADHHEYQPLLPDANSNLCLPFFCKGNLIGVLLIESSGQALCKDDLALMSKVCEQLGLAIENARLHERTKQDLVRTQALYRISQAIQAESEVQHLTDGIVAISREAVASRWAVLYKFDTQRQLIEHVSSDGDGDTALPLLNYQELLDGLTGWAIKHRQPALTNAAPHDPREHPVVRSASDGGLVRSAIVVPLMERDTPIGTIAVLNGPDDPYFDHEDLELVSAIANQAATALTQHRLRAQLHYEALHDALTGLPNRRRFKEQLNRAIAEAQRYQLRLAVLFIDLDGFKHINDTLGHQTGDRLLVEVAERLRQSSRDSDMLARMGGDEFALILGHLPPPAQAQTIYASFLRLFQTPFEIDGQQLRIGASIGVSHYPDDGSDSNALLLQADTAMYQAKGAGKNKVRHFTQALAQQAQQRLHLEGELRHALEHGDFILYYQPQIDLFKDRLIGLESLLRWPHAEHGFVPPDRFIPIAEDCGLILPLGEWVLREACRQGAVWQRAGLPLRIAVNISALQFESPTFLQLVERALTDSGLDPQQLELEVTESVVMNDVALVIERLQRLRGLGVGIAIDDFGTGYSSLRYLQQLPLDSLKIDRSFIQTMDQPDRPCSLVETIITLARNFELRTVAEGVEDHAQLECLRRLGCSEAQGYYFSKPLPAGQLWPTLQAQLAVNG